MPLHRVWEYRDIGRLFITVGGEESDNRGAEVGLGGGDSPGQSGGHSPQAPATFAGPERTQSSIEGEYAQELAKAAAPAPAAPAISITAVQSLRIAENRALF